MLVDCFLPMFMALEYHMGRILLYLISFHPLFLAAYTLWHIYCSGAGLIYHTSTPCGDQVNSLHSFRGSIILFVLVSTGFFWNHVVLLNWRVQKHLVFFLIFPSCLMAWCFELLFFTIDVSACQDGLWPILQ